MDSTLPQHHKADKNSPDRYQKIDDAGVDPGEQAAMAETLTAHGVVLARMGRHTEARDTFERAVAVAEQAGDLEGAGRAALSLVEELNERLTADEARAVYERADDLLSRTQHVETLERLRMTARLVIAAREIRAEKSEAHDEVAPAPRFVHASETTAELLRHARQVARTDKPVLISGETGTGKETLARLIHGWSARAGKFVSINCAALSSTLMELRLFGHCEGGSGEASKNHPGAAREAAGGTLLLDEIDSLDATIQAKLLRLVEYGEIFPVGALAPERVDVRIIAVANRNLGEQVARGSFREDLFYRLALQLEIPPLRERADDIVAIAKHLIEDACVRHGKRVAFTPASLEAMRSLPLRGNVRELQTLIERTVLSVRGGTEISEAAVEVVALRQTRGTGFADIWENCSLDEEVRRYEGKLIRLALGAAQGSVTHAARLLGVTYQGLAFILNSRHKELLDARKPIRRRNRSIIRIPEKA